MESRVRSAAKTISWRLIATCITILLCYIWLREWIASVSLGLLLNGLKALLYYFHERGWNVISWQRSHYNLSEVQRNLPSINQKGVTIWFTGLPSSGKSTIANAVAEELRKRGLKAERLDADIIRRYIWKELGYSKEDRDENIRRVAYLSHLLTKNGVAVVVSFISPYRELRDYARKKIGDFIEIYVKCPVEICIQRDTRGMYKKAMAGEIKNFTGISDPYEEPLQPEIVVESDKETIGESVAKILRKLEEFGYI